MISVKEKLPKPNTLCKIQVNSHLQPRKEDFRFVTYSDDTGYFWDNLKTEILQEHEVTHWKPVQ